MTDVATAADFNDVRNNLSGEYVQVANIDLSSYANFTPIGNWDSPFTGSYNGGGYSITGLNISISGTDTIYPALFACIGSGAKLQNINVVDANVLSSDTRAAILVGYYETLTAGAEISNCSVTGSATGDGDTSLLIGRGIDAASGAIIEKCSGVGTVTITDENRKAAGFGTFGAGTSNNIHIKNCYVRANIIIQMPDDELFGSNERYGFAGESLSSNMTFENCYAASTITGTGMRTDWLYGFCESDGLFTPTVTKCYYDNNLWPYNPAEEAASPRTTDEMTSPENFSTTYIDWDFTNIWVSDTTYAINAGYPHFGAAGYNIWVKKSGTFEVTEQWVKKGGTFRPFTGVWTKKGGSWNTI